MVSVAFDWSVAGKYGIGLPITLSGCAPGPVRLTMRPMIMPVVPVSTGVFTHSFALGVTGVGDDAFAGSAVAPALSPCQPLLMPMSPCARRSLEMVMRPARFGTSCHSRPLDFDMSTGLTMKNVAMYSTMPFAFLGASVMSVMIELCESIGSSSPNARPVMVS